MRARTVTNNSVFSASLSANCSQIWSLQLCSRDQSLPGPAPPQQRMMQREPVLCVLELQLVQSRREPHP